MDFPRGKLPWEVNLTLFFPKDGRHVVGCESQALRFLGYFGLLQLKIKGKVKNNHIMII